MTGSSSLNLSHKAFSFDVDGKKISAEVITSIPETSWSNYSILLTHGAGGDMYQDGLDHISNALADHGFTVYRFTCKPPNFKYRVKVYIQFIKFIQSENPYLRGCIIGGRSMGGRVAAEVASNQLVNKKFIFGVACLSYPLHKPKQNKELRLSHLVNLTVPVFIANGRQDTMCYQESMDSVLDKMTCNKTMHWFDDADHSLNLSDEEFDKLTELLVAWCQSVFSIETS